MTSSLVGSEMCIRDRPQQWLDYQSADAAVPRRCSQLLGWCCAGGGRAEDGTRARFAGRGAGVGCRISYGCIMGVHT
eukprot:4480439-Prorocentrum_lima.AAC.1